MAEDSPVDREPHEPQLRHRADRPDEAEATVRGLVEMDPKAYLNLLGVPIDGPVRVIDAGVFPNILPIDRVLRVTASESRLGVVGLAISPDPDLVSSLLVTVVSIPFLLPPSLPVEPVIVLVRPEADDPSISGEIVDRRPSGELNFGFYYRVVRAWEHPASLAFDDEASSGPGWIGQSSLPAYVAELRDRAARGEHDATTESAMCLVFAFPERELVDPELLAVADQLERMAPCVLLTLGKRQDPRIVSREEGCAVMRWTLYQRGTRTFGPPDERIAAQIGAITSPRRLTDLDRFLARIDSQNLPIATWDELLAWRAPDR